MGGGSKSDFNLNFDDMDILEMYNSDNDMDSLLLKITEGQNQPKPGQSDSCDQPQVKVHIVLIKLEFAIQLNFLLRVT